MFRTLRHDSPQIAINGLVYSSKNGIGNAKPLQVFAGFGSVMRITFVQLKIKYMFNSFPDTKSLFGEYSKT